MRLLDVAADAAAAMLAVSIAPATGVGTSFEPVFAFTDPAIDESSGLVDLGSTVLTVNDSGDDPVVYVVDVATGDTVGRTTYSADDVEDVEALAPGPDGSVWVADIGDNRAHRVSVAVYRLPPVTPGDRTVEAERYELVYRGGPTDAETLLVHPRTGRLYVVGKGLFGGRVFRAPEELRTDRPNELRPVGRVGGLVTDGAFLPDGRHVVLRDYADATVYRLEPWERVAALRMPRQQQAEGLAVRPSGEEVLVSSEGERQKVVSVGLPADLLEELAPAPETDDAATPSPSGEGTAAPRDELEVSEDLSYRDSPPTPVVVAVVAVLGAAVVLGGWAVLRGARRRSRSRR